MKEFVEKLIGRLEEEHEKCINRYGVVGGNAPAIEVKQCIEIVNQLAEEYKDKVIIDGQYCWQTCGANEHCKECNRLSNGSIDYYENYDCLAEEYNNGWIPCSERLPDNDNEVLCWYEYRIMQGTCISEMAHRYGIGWYSKKSDIWVGEVSVGVDCKVIAWQPLPQPYAEHKQPIWKQQTMNRFERLE